MTYKKKETKFVELSPSQAARRLSVQKVKGQGHQTSNSSIRRRTSWLGSSGALKSSSADCKLG